MNERKFNYSSEDFESALDFLTKSLIIPANVQPAIQPQAFLLGGQSGSGKTTLHEILKEQLHAIVINGDEYRSTHPYYRELEKEFGKESVNYTAEWASKMTEELIDRLSSVAYNLIIEGTLRTPEVPTRTAQLLRSRGYSVSLALMGVKPEISLVSCQIRYEQMRIAGTVPRATDPKHHNLIVHEIVNNLATLEQSGLFEKIYIYGRDKKCLFPTPEQSTNASKALEEILFGPWTYQEKKHFAFLQNELEALQKA